MKKLLTALLIGLGLLATTASAATYIFPSGGGTGTSTNPTYGQTLVGNALGTYTLTATSSLGLSSWATTSNTYWFTQQTTTGLAEGSNLYFTNARAQSALAGFYEVPLTFNNGLTRSVNTIGLSTIAANSVLGSYLGGIPTAIATSSLYAGLGGQVLSFVNGGWTGVATTTFSNGLTWTAGNATCNTASVSIFGCLTSADWTTFNNKISSTSLSGSAPITYNSGTGVIGCATCLTSLSGAASSTLLGDNNTFTGQNIFANILRSTTTNATTTSIFSQLFSGNLITIGTSTASTTIFGNSTSTFGGGLNLPNGGCFSIAGVCVTKIITNTTDFKQAAQWATNAILPGTPTYTNGSSGAGATLTEVGLGALTIDGNLVATGDRILVKNEVSQLTNGIYTVTAPGSGIASYVLTRATDADVAADVYPGISVYILGGTANTNTTWTMTSAAPIVMGTTALVWAESASAPLTLPISYTNGGTGATSYTTGNLIYAGATSFQSAATGTVSSADVMSVTANRFVIGGSMSISTNPGTFGGSGVYTFPQDLIVTRNLTSTNATSTNSVWATFNTGDLGQFRTITATGTGVVNQSLFKNFTYINATGTSATTTSEYTNFLLADRAIFGTSTASTTIYGNSTSTFAGGINLSSGGCFAVGGSCFTGGITRSVNSIAINTSAGATALTDYVYFVSSATTLTLPTAVGNTNKYTVTRTGVSTVIIATTGGQTINGSASANLTVQYQSLDLTSDGANWFVN